MENQKRVLIADADDAFRESLIDALTDESDLEVVGYTDDGERAVELCQTLRPDVLIMDLLLNRLDGMDVISALSGERFPILVVSASCRGKAGNLALNRGASYCMLKPCKLPAGSHDTRELMVKVTDQRLLDATGGIVQGMSGSPILQNGKLVGSVTHVLINDPTQGYGILAETMLDTAKQAQSA